MRTIQSLFAALLVAPLVPIALAQQVPTQPVALTIYNQGFAVARTSIDLNLLAGTNEVTTTGVTSMLEPDSVVLRDPAGKRVVHVVEQNYDAGVVNQQWLLEKYEGKTINFLVNPSQTVEGKIIRAGGPQSQPLIEVKGQMQFQLPGLPLFPSATDGLLLKPTLRWQIHSEVADRFSAELAYITGGLDWAATYNVVAPDNVDVTGIEKTDVHGWVTIHNQSGTEFPEARIKLMAGDVSKIMPMASGYAMRSEVMAMNKAMAMDAVQVSQKAFDDFHLYDLNRTVALRNGEIKQVQFIDATGVSMHRSYIYDGESSDVQPIYAGNINQQRGYGISGESTKVFVIEEIKNSESNHLGMPLPAGRVRLYRRDADGQMEFVGESNINHTPSEETLKIPTGSAFDVKGSRRQTDFHINQNERILDENFEIKITNQKQQPVKVTIVEHMYRGDNWEITGKSSNFVKRDSHTLAFPVQVPAKGETALTYSVHYTW